MTPNPTQPETVLTRYDFFEYPNPPSRSCEGLRLLDKRDNGRYVLAQDVDAHDAALRRQLKDSVPFSVASVWELECRRLRQRVEALENDKWFLKPDPDPLEDQHAEGITWKEHAEHGYQDMAHLQSQSELMERQRDTVNERWRQRGEVIEALTTQLAAVTQDLETQRMATYQAVAREHAVKKQLQAVTQERDSAIDNRNEYFEKLGRLQKFVDRGQLMKNYREVEGALKERDQKILLLYEEIGRKDNRIAAFQKVIDHTNKWGS